MSIPMAIVDFIPVILFLLASLLLMRDLYHMMSKGAFALLSGGLIVIVIAGLFKGLWKLLFAAGICDFEALNRCFFPMQSTGFLLAALGLIALVTRPQKAALHAAAPAAFTSSMPFVVILILGTAGFSVSLSRIAAKMGKKLAAVLFIIYLILMLGMGYLSSRDFSDPAMNWIGEGLNIVGQLLLLLTVRMLDKAGLQTFELSDKK